MIHDLDAVNIHLVNTAEHLIEASKHLSNCPEFEDEAKAIANMALTILNTIEVPEPKISDDKLNSVLEDILNA
jgi:predicted anti-sigma-YlaC factor YlaD